MKSSIVASLLVTAAGARTITVKNGCSFTIWPAMFTDPHSGHPIPDHTTGWEAAPQSSVSIPVPDNWSAGRIWGRRNCDFSKNPGPQSCVDGGCNGGLVCDMQTGTGVPPATLAEFTLGGTSGKDNYDVSLVDGFNVPIQITPSVRSCHAPSCNADLGTGCPAGLEGHGGGSPAGCLSDCRVDPKPLNSPSCCSGQFKTPATCPPSGVPHYDYFKSKCPDSYVYAFDESSGSLWTCSNTDYTVTFCP